ncbi:MAG TPA: corrinoid protein [Aggregatilineales bacterium]|nr:corrinoid protein [Aggregatilineales bacterium]
MTELNAIFDAILDGDAAAVETLTQQALDAGQSAESILREALIPAMNEVGELYEEGEYFVPEMLVAARAMKAGLAVIKPLLVEGDAESMGKVAIGTVKGDMHDVGKNLVSMMLEGAGFEIIDLGIDVGSQAFVDAVHEHGADIVAMSALLTTTMTNMRATVEALEAAGLREQVKVIIGGAPVSDEYARQIGADGYAADAGQAVKLAKSLVAV